MKNPPSLPPSRAWPVATVALFTNIGPPKVLYFEWPTGHALPGRGELIQIEIQCD